MNTSRIFSALIACGVIMSMSACANLCQRRDRVLTRMCDGTGVVFQPDMMCEANLDNCSEGKLRQFEAYVECIEAMNVCSLEAINACASKYPGGRNLQCAVRG
ncbi:MAG: hypothetical protein VYC39_16285 [Myxococcota bacterium]|nr:hypothetical protein [Myxococcota bacterium]